MIPSLEMLWTEALADYDAQRAEQARRHRRRRADRARGVNRRYVGRHHRGSVAA